MVYTREQLVNTGEGLYTDRITYIWWIGQDQYITTTKGEYPRSGRAEFAGSYDPLRPEQERWNWI